MTKRITKDREKKGGKEKERRKNSRSKRSKRGDDFDNGWPMTNRMRKEQLLAVSTLIKKIVAM